jgi:hypothetical protein
VAGGRLQRLQRLRPRAGPPRLLPALEAVDPRAEANVVRTAELLRDEAEVLDVVVDTALAGRDCIAWTTCGRCRAPWRGSSCAASPRT